MLIGCSKGTEVSTRKGPGHSSDNRTDFQEKQQEAVLCMLNPSLYRKLSQGSLPPKLNTYFPAKNRLTSYCDYLVCGLMLYSSFTCVPISTVWELSKIEGLSLATHLIFSIPLALSQTSKTSKETKHVSFHPGTTISFSLKNLMSHFLTLLHVHSSTPLITRKIFSLCQPGKIRDHSLVFIFFSLCCILSYGPISVIFLSLLPWHPSLPALWLHWLFFPSWLPLQGISSCEISFSFWPYSSMLSNLHSVSILYVLSRIRFNS